MGDAIHTFMRPLQGLVISNLPAAGNFIGIDSPAWIVKSDESNFRLHRSM